MTGAARGIGKGCAAALASRGARILLADLDERPLNDAVTELSSGGAEVAGRVTDVRAWDSVEEMTEACIHAFGGIDFVVANAGIGDYSTLDTGDPERWRRVIETNFLGVLHTVRAAFPRMKERGGGQIVLMASIAGRQPGSANRCT